MDQYIELCQRILTEGKFVENDRTQSRCLTVINHDLTYTEFPIITTRKSYWKPAIAELICYLRGYNSAAQFRTMGTNTWDANANKNIDWLNNPNRQGEDDCGLIYGKLARNYPKPDGGTVDLLRKIVYNLTNCIDDRGEILTFYHPGSFHLACLRPCLHTHQFSIVDETLYLNSFQRSCDVPLGLNFNMIQVYTLLRLMCQLTRLQFGAAYHKIVNAHVYENQIESLKLQVNRVPIPGTKLKINPEIKSLSDIETWVTVSDFEVEDYLYHPPIKYPFTV